MLLLLVMFCLGHCKALCPGALSLASPTHMLDIIGAMTQELKLEPISVMSTVHPYNYISWRFSAKSFYLGICMYNLCVCASNCELQQWCNWVLNFLQVAGFNKMEFPHIFVVAVFQDFAKCWVFLQVDFPNILPSALIWVFPGQQIFSQMLGFPWAWCMGIVLLATNFIKFLM